MTRLLALLVVMLVVAHFYQRARLAIAKANADRFAANHQRRAGRPSKVVLPLVPCATCGVRVAADLAVGATDGSDRRFCSENCLNQDS